MQNNHQITILKQYKYQLHIFLSNFNPVNCIFLTILNVAITFVHVCLQPLCYQELYKSDLSEAYVHNVVLSAKVESNLGKN